MARNDLPKLISALEKAAASVAYEGPRQACELIVADLQEQGPSWSGRFSNSWAIDAPDGLPGSAKGTGGEGDAKPLRSPKVSFSVIAKKLQNKTETVFVIGNFSKWASQAIDEQVDVFFRPFYPPKTRLGKERVARAENSGGPRKGKTLRGDLPSGNGGSSRTAELYWFQKYNDGGKRDQVINSTLSKALRGIK